MALSWAQKCVWCCQSLWMPVFAVFHEWAGADSFQRHFRNSREVVLGQCQKPYFQKSLAFEMPKRFVAISRSKVGFILFGRSCPKNYPQKIVLFSWHAAIFVGFTCGAHCLNLGGWKLRVCGSITIARNCDIYFLGGRERFQGVLQNASKYLVL